MPQCFGTIFLWLTISERLTSCALGVAFPSMSLEETLPLAGWSSRECPWLTGLRRDLSNLDVTTSNQSDLIEISRRHCLWSIGSYSGLSFCSTESSAFYLGMVKRSGLPLLNGGFRRSALLNHQVPQFMFIVEDFWMSDAYSRVKQVHFGNDNANVMFMLVLKSNFVHWNYDI